MVGQTHRGAEEGEANRSRDKLATLVRTLIGNGFHPENVTTGLTHHVIECSRLDEFGVPIPYWIVLCDGQLNAGTEAAIRRDAANASIGLIYVDSESEHAPSFRYDDFLARCGGEIQSWLPVQLDFREKLTTLGSNQLPQGITGTPDAVYEDYVGLGLQFLLGRRVFRYGSERRGQIVPDGLAISRQGRFFLYDAKAYAGGFEVNRPTIRQFTEYVVSFHRKYEHHVGRAHSFIVVANRFQHTDRTKQARSRDLYAACGVNLSFLTSEHLVDSIELFRARSVSRGMIDWGTVFSAIDVVPSLIRDQMEQIDQDGLV